MRLHLHFTAKAAAAEAQKLKKQAVWVRMHLQGRRGRERVVLSLRSTPFPLRKKWSQWEMEFALSIEDRFGKGVRDHHGGGGGGGGGGGECKSNSSG